jgi:hypothetical protein
MSEATFEILRLGLAAVLTIAAVGKLLHPTAFHRGLADFGVPDTLIGPLSRAIPAVELVLAAALIPAATARAAAIAAAALLLVFSAAMARLIARGEQPDCACFGAIAGERVGPTTLARNGALVGVAVAVAIGTPHESAVAWLAGAEASTVAIAGLALVVALEALLLVQLFRQGGRLLNRVDALEQRTRTGPAVGDPMPEILEPLPLPATLLFTDAGCAHCGGLVDAVADRDDVVVLGLDDARDAFGIAGVPAAVAYDADGRVAAPLAMGRDQVAELLRLDEARLEVIQA